MAAAAFEAPKIIRPIAASAGLDDLQRITLLLSRAEPAVQQKFLEMTGAARKLGNLEQIATLLEAGRVEEALAFADGIAEGIAVQLEQAYQASGFSSAAALRTKVDTLFDFSTMNDRAIRDMRGTRVRLIREFNAGQRRATQVFLEDAFARGLAPVEQARALKKSIGLTEKQSRAVVNFRRMLSSENADQLSEALSRKLRDKRFDRTIQGAIRGDRVLTPAQIDRMVQRYEERYIQYRANVIARTETLAAVHAGDEEMWNQAIESGAVEPDQVITTWHTARDERVRGSHRSMNGQTVLFGEPFTSGRGNSLRYPGDPQGAGSETINCRCVVSRKFRDVEAEEAEADLRIRVDAFNVARG